MSGRRQKLLVGWRAGALLAPLAAAQSTPSVAQKLSQLTPQDIPAVLERARKGDYESQLLLGIGYDRGKLLGHDPSQARYWLAKAAEHGDPHIEMRVSEMYGNGEGGPADL